MSLYPSASVLAHVHVPDRLPVCGCSRVCTCMYVFSSPLLRPSATRTQLGVLEHVHVVITSLIYACVCALLCFCHALAHIAACILATPFMCTGRAMPIPCTIALALSLQKRRIRCVPAILPCGCQLQLQPKSGLSSEHF